MTTRYERISFAPPEFLDQPSLSDTDPKTVPDSEAEQLAADSLWMQIFGAQPEYTDVMNVDAHFEEVQAVYHPIVEQGITVTDIDEIERLQSRGKYPETYLNGNQPINAGPDCRELYPWLMTDPYDYGSLLKSVELREIIASTAMAVLDDADSITTIVGEDTSGRVPALIIGKALNTVRRQQGLSPVRRVFMAGRIGQGLQPDFEATSPEDKAVLVTEYVASGASANGSLDALRRAGYVAPAVVALDRAAGGIRGAATLDTDRMYMGARDSYTTRADNHLYGISKAVKGVVKLPGDEHSMLASLDEDDRRILLRTRADIDHFADEIVAIWYLRQQQE